MSGTKVRINKHDDERVLLTDLLPYEVPLRFTTLFYYSKVKRFRHLNNNRNWVTKIINQTLPSGSQPYEYSARKDITAKRSLHVMHPLGMLAFCTLYSRFSENMVSSCKLSSRSLRHPARLARMYFDTAGITDQQNQLLAPTGDPGQPEAATVDAPTVTSYFAYSPYPFLHDFFESEEFERLEQQFPRYTNLDVASCFASIYTHSLSWAVRGKTYAKRDSSSKYSFDSGFDRVMRSVNHNETVGILVGPEASRVFAEIILQSVDCQIEDQCSKLGLIPESDFAIRRYVDDYFVFFARRETYDQVLISIEESLSRVKLRLNHAKTTEHSRPFVTRLSRLKRGLSRALSEYFQELSVTSEPYRPTLARRRGFTQTAKSIIAAHDENYSNCVPFLLSCVRNKLLSAYRDAPADAIRIILNSRIIRDVFFFLAVTGGYQAGIVVGRIISEMREFGSKHGGLVSNRLNHAVAEEFHGLLRTMAETDDCPQFELANLFVAICDIEEVHPIPNAIIAKIWQNGANSYSGDYFISLCLLFSFGGRREYAHHTANIQDAVVDKVLNDSDFSRAEVFMATLDIIACPYVEEPQKGKVARPLAKWANGGTSSPNVTDLNRLVSEVSEESWFFDWNKERPTGFYIKKKAVCSAY